MNIFRRPDYRSDATQFIDQLKVAKPTLEAEQRKGRALLWDKAPLSLTDEEKAKESRVKQQAYVYQNKL